MIPHLIHIGAAKTGSTFLQDWFESNPQTIYTAGGVAGFGNVRQMAYGLQAREASGRLFVTSSEALYQPPLRGERLQRVRSAEEIRRERANVCAGLADLFPKAHVLLVTRGFESLIKSQRSQVVRSALPYDKINPLGGSLESKDSWPPDAVANMRQIYDYDTVLALYRERFGDRFFVLPYELLKQDPVAFVSQLERRFALDHHQPAEQVVNPSLSAREISIYPTIAKLLNSMPSARLRARLLNAHRNAIRRGTYRPLLPLLETVFRPSVTEIAPQAFFGHLRGLARELVKEPHYAPFAEAYLEPPP